MKNNNAPEKSKKSGNKPLLTIESTIMMYLYQINNLSSQVTDNLLRRYNISDSQYMVLIVIYILGDKATPSEIGRPLLRRPHSISAILERMEKTGLVAVSGGTRGKPKKAVITKKGMEIVNDFPINDYISSLLSNLTPKQRKEFLSYLKTFRSSLINKLGIRNLSID